MMVYAQARAISSAFYEGQPVVTNAETSLRLGPGTNYASLNTIYPGAQGMIQSHDLDGVLAKGFCWWKVAFGGNTGWVNERALSGGSMPPAPPAQGDFNLFLPLLNVYTAPGTACLVR
jgi:uncharacterized protein YraI